MIYCNKCGKENAPDAIFCSGCGESLIEQQNQEKQSDNFNDSFRDFTATVDMTDSYSYDDISRNRVMGIFAYIIFLVPLFAARDSKFARFHTNQGIVITLGSASVSITASITKAILQLLHLYPLANLVGIILHLIALGAIPLTVLGIIYAAKGQAKELPLVNKIKILK